MLPHSSCGCVSRPLPRARLHAVLPRCSAQARLQELLPRCRALARGGGIGFTNVNVHGLVLVVVLLLLGGIIEAPFFFIPS